MAVIQSQGMTGYNVFAPASTTNAVDTRTHVRSIVLARLEDLRRTLHEYDKRQAILAESQEQAAQELVHLESILESIDRGSDGDVVPLGRTPTHFAQRVRPTGPVPHQPHHPFDTLLEKGYIPT